MRVMKMVLVPEICIENNNIERIMRMYFKYMKYYNRSFGIEKTRNVFKHLLVYSQLSQKLRNCS